MDITYGRLRLHFRESAEDLCRRDTYTQDSARRPPNPYVTAQRHFLHAGIKVPPLEEDKHPSTGSESRQCAGPVGSKTPYDYCNVTEYVERGGGVHASRRL